MEIEQIIRFDRYFVRKTGEHQGELVHTDKGNGQVYLVCCLNCFRGDRFEEEHVVDILAACRALDITTLTAGHLWGTIIPSLTVTLVDVSGEQRIITEELEQAKFESFLRHCARPCNFDGETTEEDATKAYLQERRSLYGACGVPCPLGAG